MALMFTVGGVRGAFEPRIAEEVADLLDHAFGSERRWETEPPLHYGEQADAGWAELQRRASLELGPEEIPNLLAIDSEIGGVYLPAHVQAISLPLAGGLPLRCASLPGLRSELAELGRRWELPTDDEGLLQLLNVGRDPDDGWVSDAPEILTFARLSLAANEAVRRDCPLCLVGDRI
jgi:hypothetical protein